MYITKLRAVDAMVSCCIPLPDALQRLVMLYWRSHCGDIVLEEGPYRLAITSDMGAGAGGQQLPARRPTGTRPHAARRHLGDSTRQIVHLTGPGVRSQFWLPSTQLPLADYTHRPYQDGHATVDPARSPSPAGAEDLASLPSGGAGEQ